MQFDEGLSDAEIVRAEEKYGVRFPPDLRDLCKLPYLYLNPNPDGSRAGGWRSQGTEKAIRRSLARWNGQ